MHPTTCYQLAHAHAADLHQRAARERTARAAIQRRRAQPDHRAGLVTGHAGSVLARVLTLAGGHRLSPRR